MKRYLLAAAVTASLLAGARAAETPALDRFVVLEKDAVFMLRPRLVCTGDVHWARPSADGRYVLAWRSEDLVDLPELPRPNPPRHSLILWNSGTGQVRQIYSIRAPEPPEARFHWLGKSHIIAGHLDVERPLPGQKPKKERWLFRLDARSGALKPVLENNGIMYVLPSPTTGTALVLGAEPSLRLLKPDGAAVVIDLPAAFRDLSIYWSGDGRFAVTHQPRTRPGPIPCALIDMTSGAVSFRDNIPPLWSESESEPELRLRSIPSQLAGSPGRAMVTAIWLNGAARGDQPSALLAPHAKWAEVTRSQDAALYADGSALWVVGLIRMPRTAFVAARKEDARVRAKTLANAFQMYAQDYDEVLPGAEQAIQEIIRPYTPVRSGRTFDGFVYTYGGGPLAAIAEPGKTVLGYLHGPDGVVNIYADGHVGWAPAR